LIQGTKEDFREDTITLQTEAKLSISLEKQYNLMDHGQLISDRLDLEGAIAPLQKSFIIATSTTEQHCSNTRLY
jgi:hypothetical protein